MPEDPFKLIVPVPAPKFVNVCEAELLQLNIAPEETLNIPE